MKLRFMFILVSLVIAVSGVTYGQSITIDHVDGLLDPTHLAMETPIVFHIRMAAGPDNHKGITNGWRIYSDDGAEWDTTLIVKTDALTKDDDFDLVYTVKKVNTDGMLSDTVGIVGAVAFFTVGMPPDFDSITHMITIGGDTGIDPSQEGKTICIDSCFYYPSGVWKWADIQAFPEWYTEPICYTIGAGGGDPPAIECPVTPFAFELCAPEEITVPLVITDAETVDVTPLGSWAADELSFTPDTAGLYSLHVTATNGEGFDECDVFVVVSYTTPVVIDCPTEPFEVALSEPGEVCVPLGITGYTSVDVTGTATWSSGMLCFSAPPVTDTYIFTVTATGNVGCGFTDECVVTINVTATPAPVITCPGEPIDMTPCSISGNLCIDLVIVNATSVVVTGSDGTWVDDMLCFDYAGAATLNFHVVASNGDATDECDITVNVSPTPPVSILCPGSPVDVTVGGPGEVCVTLPASNYGEVTSDVGTWTDGQLCFDAASEGAYPFVVTATSTNPACPSAVCEFTVNVAFTVEVTIDCPPSALAMDVCETEEICFDLAIVNATDVVVTETGGATATWADGKVCFTHVGAGTYEFHVVASNGDAIDECDITLNLSFLPLPEITCPSSPIDVETCEGSGLCFDVPITGATSVTTNFGSWDADVFCFTPDGASDYHAVITATNDCGSVDCYLDIYVTYFDAPVAEFSAAPTAGPVPLEVVFTNASTGWNLSYDWNFDDGSASAESDPTHTFLTLGCYDVTLTVTDGCGLTDAVTYQVCATDEQVVIITDRWNVVGCDGPTLAGEPLVEGDVVTVYDNAMTLCGMGVVDATSHLEFNFYGDDPSTGVDEGPLPGEQVFFQINGVDVVTAEPVIFVWLGEVVIHEVCTFLTSCLSFDLDAGWHLISWNNDYNASIEDFVTMIGCVDIALGFDQGGLTYDPDLPQFSNLDNVDYRNGYWVRLTCDARFEICGEEVVDGAIAIYSGWNLVSYLPAGPLPVEDALGSIWDILILVYGYDHEFFDYIKGAPLRGTLVDMAPKFGYWIKASGDGTLVYPGFDVAGKIVNRAPRIESPVTATRNWMSLYGENITIDGQAIADHSTIEAYTLSGTLCGMGEYTNNILKFTPVYGYDEDAAAYPQVGDRIEIRINGQGITRDITYGESGTLVNLSNLAKGADMVPDGFRLSQNYPNPFNPSTTIGFNLTNASRVELSVYNVLGQSVTTLVNEYMAAGDHKVTWNGDDANGNRVTSGVYFYKISTADFSETKKMILMK